MSVMEERFGWQTTRLVLTTALVLLLSVSAALVRPQTADADDAGIDWVVRNAAADNEWLSVTYNEGIFVAVAQNGTGTRVMTSPDGIDWTIRTSAADNLWRSVTYGNGQFVAVGSGGTGNRVMTSPDGIDWTIRTSAADNTWRSVTYGNGLFVAVASSGTGNRVMTSPDGINWTARASAADNEWNSVTYGNGLFVAVSFNGTPNQVMTSPDGINWTLRSLGFEGSWRSVTHNGGLYVAVGQSDTRVMTSPDGITWTPRTAASNRPWLSVTFGAGLYIAIAAAGVADQVMTSPDGITWTTRISPANNEWNSVAFGHGIFVSVAQTGTGNRVMTSGPAPPVVAVDTEGSGSGTVTSNPPAIECGPLAPACERSFAPGSSVTLTAEPEPGSVFTGWSGACSGIGTCQLTLNAAKSVTASFEPGFQLAVTRSGSGTGTVISIPAGIDCGAVCTAGFIRDSVVTLTAKPNQGSSFSGFSGACSGLTTCTVTMNEAREVNADFALSPARFSRLILTPRKKKLKAGKALKMTIRVTNSGGQAGVATVKLISGSKKKLKVPKSVRVRVPAGGTVKKTFRARSAERQKGKVKVTAKLSGLKSRSVLTLKR